MPRPIRRPAAPVLCAALAAAMLLGGCTVHVKSKKKTGTGATDISIQNETYAIVLPAEESVYDDLIVQGFSEIIDLAGHECVVKRPKGGTVLEQQKIVRSLIKKEVSCIAIAPVDAEAMSDILKEALENGINVCSFSQPADPAARELTISNLGSDSVAVTLMNAVLDLAGGKGQWAILSASSVSVSQNLWIEKMKTVMKDDVYRDLELLEIAYGNDQYQMAYNQTKALLQNYPDLKVICVPTTEGITAAVQAVTDEKADVMVTGFGLPSEMKDFVLTQDSVCPYFYLWNPVDLGNLTAYVSAALYQGKITGELGEKFRAGSLGEYEVTAADDGGTEVILEEPVRFDADNIEKWAEIF